MSYNVISSFLSVYLCRKKHYNIIIVKDSQIVILIFNRSPDDFLGTNKGNLTKWLNCKDKNKNRNIIVISGENKKGEKK